MNSSERRRLEEVWRDRLRSADQRYREASAHFRTVQQETPRGTASVSDSNYAYQQALRRENDARAEYVRTLQAFTRLVLYGEPPDATEPKA